MATSANNLVLYSDIYALFSSLNTARSTHGLSAVSAPASLAQGTIIKKEVPDTLKAYIEASTDSHVSSSTAATGVTLPSVGSLISPSIFTRFSSVINTIKNTCHNDANYGNCFCFSCNDNSNNSGHCSFSFGFGECNQS